MLKEPSLFAALVQTDQRMRPEVRAHRVRPWPVFRRPIPHLSCQRSTSWQQVLPGLIGLGNDYWAFYLLGQDDRHPQPSVTMSYQASITNLISAVCVQGAPVSARALSQLAISIVAARLAAGARIFLLLVFIRV
jgi:hypothetical protein